MRVLNTKGSISCGLGADKTLIEMCATKTRLFGHTHRSSTQARSRLASLSLTRSKFNRRESSKELDREGESKLSSLEYL